MSESQMTREQAASLDEAVRCAQLAEQQARELSDWGDIFAAKWEKHLRDAETAVVPKSKS